MARPPRGSAANGRRQRHAGVVPRTEAHHPRSEDLDLLSAQEVVRRLHREDVQAVHAVGRVASSVGRAAQLATDALRQGGRLIYVGAGTSGRLGALDAAEIPPTYGTRPGQVRAVIAGGTRALRRAVEGAEDDTRAGRASMRELEVSPADFVCAISASGTTPFVLSALRAARQRKAKTALVCCGSTARARKKADVLICIDVGPELVAGSTRLKSGTATKLVLNALSTAAMVGLGKVYRGRMVDLRPTNQKLERRAHAIVRALTGLDAAGSRALLRRARGHVKIAVAMHQTGLDYSRAQRALEGRSLRELECDSD